MIRAEFYVDRNARIVGYHIKGHAELAKSGEDVLCAFVSSAAYMTANTITEIIGAKAQAEAEDGDMKVTIAERELEACQTILAGLKLHLEETEKQYPDNLKVIITEV